MKAMAPSPAPSPNPTAPWPNGAPTPGCTMRRSPPPSPPSRRAWRSASPPIRSARAAQQERLHLPRFPVDQHRLLPADRARCARPAPPPRRGEIGADAYDARMRDADRRGDRLAGGRRRRRARPWRVRTQRHGEVFRRTPVRLCLHQAWLGAVLRQPLRRPADHLGRRLAPRPMTVEWATYAQSLTDKPVKGMLTGPVTMLFWAFVREDIPRAGRLHPDRPRAARGSGATSNAPASPSSRSTSRRSARACRCAAPTRPPISTGRRAASACRPAAWRTRRRSTPTCATPSSTTSSAPSRRWMRMSISIETARSRMELLRAFVDFDYPNADRPGPVGHPFPARSRHRRNGGPAAARRRAPCRATGCG